MDLCPPLQQYPKKTSFWGCYVMLQRWQVAKINVCHFLSQFYSLIYSEFFWQRLSIASYRWLIISCLFFFFYKTEMVELLLRSANLHLDKFEGWLVAGVSGNKLSQFLWDANLFKSLRCIRKLKREKGTFFEFEKLNKFDGNKLSGLHWDANCRIGKWSRVSAHSANSRNKLIRK